MRAHDFIVEKKKRRRNKYGLAAWGPGPYGWYGYDAGYSGSGSDGGGGESIEYNTSEDQDLSIDVAKAISRLPDGRLKDVIEMRFKYDMTYDAIGKELGVGTERARQIVAKAIRHLRHPKYGLTDNIKEGKFRANDIEEFKPSNDDLNDLKSKYLPDWEMLDHRILQAKYVAADHREAEAFVRIINRLSEKMDHFCEVTQDVAEVTVRTTTFDVKGLTILDFQIAMIIDRFADDVKIKQVPMSGNFGMHEDWKTALAGAALSTGIAMGGSADAKVNVGIDNQGYNEPIQLIQQVKKGDTVYSIARKYGVGPDDIRRVNDLDKNYTISPGQELAIPKKTAGKKTTTANTPPKIAVNKTLTGTTHEAILTAEARKSGITDPIELAAFLAQCAHESHDFKSMIEYGSPSYFKQYEPKFLKDKKTGKVIVDPKTKKYKNFNDKAVDLGNNYRGDGIRYKGRGYIQLTGRDNYKRVGKALGLDLVNNPELAEKPEIAAKVAVLYWKNRTQPRVDDFNDVRAVTKTINPGLNGLKDRKETFADFKKFKMASIK